MNRPSAGALLAAKAPAIPGMHSPHLTVPERWMDELLLALVIGAVFGLSKWRPEMPWHRRRREAPSPAATAPQDGYYRPEQGR